MAQNVAAKALIIENSYDTHPQMLPGSFGQLVKIPTVKVTKSVVEKSFPVLHVTIVFEESGRICRDNDTIEGKTKCHLLIPPQKNEAALCCPVSAASCIKVRSRWP